MDNAVEVKRDAPSTPGTRAKPAAPAPREVEIQLGALEIEPGAEAGGDATAVEPEPVETGAEMVESDAPAAEAAIETHPATDAAVGAEAVPDDQPSAGDVEAGSPATGEPSKD